MRLPERSAASTSTSTAVSKTACSRMTMERGAPRTISACISLQSSREHPSLLSLASAAKHFSVESRAFDFTANWRKSCACASMATRKGSTPIGSTTYLSDATACFILRRIRQLRYFRKRIRKARSLVGPRLTAV